MAIKRCTCVHAQQDKIHGKGMRVMNRMANGNYRCTVCGSVQNGGK